MRYRKTENVMSILGGALLGATAMYLLDPEMGDKRRARIKDQAGDYLSDASHALHSGLDTVTDTARGVGHTIADKAEDYASRLSDLAHDYGQRLSDHAEDIGASLSGQTEDARSRMSDAAANLRSRGMKWWNRYKGKAGDYASQASDMADDYSDRGSDAADHITTYGNQLWKRVRGLGDKLNTRASDAMDRARRATGEEPQMPVVPVAVTAVGCCAMGLGLMYLMDPERGRARRNWLSDKVGSVFHRAGRTAYYTGKNVANRAYGTVHETASRWQQSGQPVSSEQLMERVRAELGHVVSQPSQVQVIADANGSVTLSGTILRDESDRLIRIVEAVPGVILVINRLDLKDTPQSSVSQT